MAELPKNTQSTNLQQLASRRRRVASQAAAVRELQAQYDSLDPEEASESLRNSMENKEWWTAKDLGKSVVGGVYNAGLSLHNLGMATFGKGHRAFPQESFYEPETIGGGVVSGMSQWATGFLGSLGTVKGAKALTKKKLEKEVDEPNENTVALFSYNDKYTFWKGDAILRDKENEGNGNLDWEKDAEDRVKAKIGYGTYGKVKA